jgi:glyoxylase-like metal-dependent hydrolase (beta-lactamase superfamily II)
LVRTLEAASWRARTLFIGHEIRKIGDPKMIPRTTPRHGLMAVALVSLVALGSQAEVRSADGQELSPASRSELPPLNYVEVSDSVILLQNDRLNGSNITCFALEDGLVFVDASLFTEIAARFRKDMEARFQKKTLALLLSHAHTDHFFGMGAFSDVPVVAAASAREPFQRQLSIDFEGRVEGYKRIFPKFGEALKTARLSMPTIWFEEEIQFGSGESLVRFRNTGGHSSGSSYVHSPSQGVIAVGDNVQVDAYPYFGEPTGNMDTWIQTLKGWETFKEITICPGHGRPVDRAYLTSVRVYFEDLVSALGKLRAGRVPAEEVVVHETLPKGYWGTDHEQPAWWLPSVAGLYRSIEAP